MKRNTVRDCDTVYGSAIHILDITFVHESTIISIIKFLVVMRGGNTEMT